MKKQIRFLRNTDFRKKFIALILLAASFSSCDPDYIAPLIAWPFVFWGDKQGDGVQYTSSHMWLIENNSSKAINFIPEVNIASIGNLKNEYSGYVKLLETDIYVGSGKYIECGNMTISNNIPYDGMIDLIYRVFDSVYIKNASSVDTLITWTRNSSAVADKGDGFYCSDNWTIIKMDVFITSCPEPCVPLLKYTFTITDEMLGIEPQSEQ